MPSATLSTSTLLPVYARREPTVDELARGTGEFDVVVYSDKACTQPKARFPWYHSNKPDRRYRRVVINCYSWKLLWLPDLTVETV